MAALATGAAAVPAAFGATSATSSAETTSEAVALTTAPVTRGDLAETRTFTGSVSFGDTWTIGQTASGTITAAPDQGAVIRPGQELVRIDDRPLTLARGDMPMFRTLRRIRSGERDEFNNRLSAMEGDDVRQLQNFLLEAGHDDEERLVADGIFARSTERAVEAWQREVGLPVSGRVDGTQLVYASTPLRISSQLRVGDAFSGVSVGEADAHVTVDTSTRDRAALPLGAAVSIDVDGASPVSGNVTAQEQVTNEQGQRVWRTTITPGGPLATGGTGATVEVEQRLATDVTLVPVGALLALAEGGFAVELVAEDGPTALRRVEVGEVLEGLAEISGQVSEGERVVVPT